MDETGIIPRAQRAGFRPRSLDAVNFLLADVRGPLMVVTQPTSV